MSDKGKNFEGLISRWFKELNIYCHRFLDSRSMGQKGPGQPADYFIWYKGNLIYIECKDYSGTSLAFDAFSPSQWKSAMLGEPNNITHIAVVRLSGTIYCINMIYMLIYIKDPITERKSFSRAYFKEHAIIIESKQDLLSFINKTINS